MVALDFRKLSGLKPKKFEFNDLIKAFDDSIEKATKNVKKAAVLFSGGVDSSLIAKTASERINDCRLFSVGLSNSHDLVQARNASKLLGLELIEKEIQKPGLKGISSNVSKIIDSKDFLQLSIAVPEFVALSEIKKHRLITVFSGQGADELFLGYAVFPRLLKEAGAGSVRKEQRHLFGVFQQRNVKREKLLAKHFSLDVRMPFLDEKFAAIALSIPVKQNLENNLRKNVFRKLALHYKIPEQIALMPKKAIQYGSGVSKELKKIA